MKSLKIFFFLLLLTTLYLLPPTLDAQETSLTVSPPLLEIEMMPPSQIETPIRIRNDSKEPITLQVVLRPFTPQGESGDIQYIETSNSFPGANPKITDRIKVRQNSQPVTTFDLAPQEEKELELYIGLEEKEPHSDYYFSILFIPPDTATTTPNSNEENGSTVRGGIAINVLLSIGPKGAAKGSIEEFSSPTLLQTGPVPFTVRVKNTGSRYISPKGTITISNMFGQKIGRVNLMQANILPGTIRAFLNEDLIKQSLEEKRNAESKNNKDEIKDPKTAFAATWPETFLIGPYTATLQVRLSETTPVIVKKHQFFAAPIHFVIGLILFVILLFVIKKRVQSKLSSQ